MVKEGLHIHFEDIAILLRNQLRKDVI